jgi:hemolysin III
LIFIALQIVVLLTLPAAALTLLVVGGAAYVIGILFFIMGERTPIFHVVWHCFVLMAALVHWLDVYFFIVPLRIGDEIGPLSGDIEI